MAKAEILLRHISMDQVRNSVGYVDHQYLSALAPILHPIKKRSYELMELTSGLSVLDVGCGPGIDTIAMASLVGPTGTVAGIDYDHEMVATANKEAERSKVSKWVTHRVGDGNKLLWADNTFDAVHAERLFQHLKTPDLVLSEMIRVAKKGGRIVVADTDYSSVSVDTANWDIEWKLRRIRVDRLNNGYVGRQLFRRFKQQRLTGVTVEVFPTVITDYELGRHFTQTHLAEQEALDKGVITSEEIEVFQHELMEASVRGHFFSYGNVIIARGIKGLA